MSLMDKEKTLIKEGALYKLPSSKQTHSICTYMHPRKIELEVSLCSRAVRTVVAVLVSQADTLLVGAASCSGSGWQQCKLHIPCLQA